MGRIEKLLEARLPAPAEDDEDRRMTHDEKVAMYMKLTKRELAEMLAKAMGPQVACHYEPARDPFPPCGKY